MKSNTIKMITRINQFLKLMYVLITTLVLFLAGISLLGQPKLAQSVKVPYKLSNKQAMALSEAGVPNLSTSSRYVVRDGKKVPLHFKDGTENLSRYSINIQRVYTINSSNGMLLFFFNFAKILFILLGIYLLRKILTNTKQDHPFVFNNVQNLRRISYLIFAYVILDWCYENLFMPYMSQQIIPGNYHSISIGIDSTHIALILLGFLVLTIASVFQHGYNMKQELDLTI